MILCLRNVLHVFVQNKPRKVLGVILRVCSDSAFVVVTPSGGAEDNVSRVLAQNKKIHNISSKFKLKIHNKNLTDNIDSK